MNQYTRKLLATAGALAVATTAATAVVSASPVSAWPSFSSSSPGTHHDSDGNGEDREDTGHTSPGAEDSHIHTSMGWQPGDHDTCSKDLHDSFTVIGADGKRYETWHPSVVTDPDTGVKCTFGHEHGDDPTTSDIFDLVSRELSAPGFEDQAGIPFGLTSEASTEYAQQAGVDIAHRHEDHVGHKVVVLNDVTLINADHSQGYVLDPSGDPVECDYLMKMHQGSHSSDATKNSSHELIYAAQCSDGTELVVSHLTSLGNPNEFTQTCSDKVISTAGSNLPAGQGGRRRIPDLECLTTSDDIWATYETWEVESAITTADGKTLASFDPWFGIRNPSRYFDNNTSDLTNGGRPMVDLAGMFEGEAYPWSEVTPGMDKNDPDSPFNGAQRDSYVADTIVDNHGGVTTWYTDPYGGNASTTPFAGSVRQHISATSNGNLPELARQAFGFSRDYGGRGSGVHAPN